ncbi:RNA polymerase I-specific transcription initiation factor RRN3 [Phlebotomus argentipes]|uniref:RNA polymerase I-specific transcription initiation factor RRN3 n=1 Tax=Phlebotomus argentipes TaxID=94469 RepID=UPI0028933FDE|nr:RNA polymerase I-specific transcription initiation factor RRN3 [Phlebotomus argentipes]
MSIISERTITSILKEHSSISRDRARLEAHNKVRFSLTSQKTVQDVLTKAIDGNFADYEEYITMMRTSALPDEAFLNTVRQSKECIHLLRPQFMGFVETLLSLNWTKRSAEIREEFKAFLLELLVTHNKYARIGIDKLVSTWIPEESAAASWPLGAPNEEIRERLSDVHEVMAKLVELIPMASSVIIRAIDTLFPYFRRSAHILGGYLHNVFWLLSYQPVFTEDVLRIVLTRLLKVDVNAPRNEIEDAELEDEDMENLFEMEDVKSFREDEMRNSLAESLDICLGKIFEFLQRELTKTSRTPERTFKSIMNVFEAVILPAHNPHHIQFFIFYSMSLRPAFVQHFVNTLWTKVCNPNVAPAMRQVCVYYIASLLARAKFLPMDLLRQMLKELCSWAHQYISRYDSSHSDTSIRAHGVFFAICQAVFYVIAFRSRDLTSDKDDLIFLQSLHLSAIVTSPLNPLRVCLPTIATAFAGVTRAHQLTYCHTILERNARKKLATVYMSDVEMPEECLDTFFPFDPFLLKKSSSYIERIYLKYQASEAEEKPEEDSTRKRKDTIGDDDDFIAEKRLKADLARSHERELQFSYSISPGFHT